MFRGNSFWLIATASIAGILMARTAAADLIASESFAYVAGTQLNGGSGGSGWSGAWVTGQPAVFINQASSLAGGIASTGGSLFYDGSKVGGGARIFRPVATGTGTPAELAGLVESHVATYFGTIDGLGRLGTSVWLGVVINGGTAGSGLPGTAYLAQIHLYDGARTDPGSLALGDANKDGEAIAIGRGNVNTAWNYERTCSHSYCESGASSSTSYLSIVTFDSGTHWLVLRFDFASALTTNITMWLDPAPGAQAPTNASALAVAGQQVVAVDGFHFNYVEFGGGTSQFAFDEFRLATSFGDLSSGSLSAPTDLKVNESIRLSASPSPFIGGSTLHFSLPFAQAAEIRVVDVSGRLVRRLASGDLGEGKHALWWDGNDQLGQRVGGGIYFVRLRTSAGERTVKLVRLQ